MKKLDRKYIYKRIAIFVFPIIIGMIVQFLVKGIVQKTENENIREIIVCILGIWGSILGFIITVESIFVGFEGKNIEVLRGTRVYKTMIFTFTLTCLELILCIAVFISALFLTNIGVFVRRALVCGVVVTFIEVFLCIVFLAMGVYDSLEK